MFDQNESSVLLAEMIVALVDSSPGPGKSEETDTGLSCGETSPI
jgi:hypothetical protein